MITEKDGLFALETAKTSYLFAVTDTGHLEHLYYGRKIRFRDDKALREKHAFCPGNGIYYDSRHKNFSLEDACLEMSSYGKGDIREPFVELVNADGSFTSDFLYDSFAVMDTKLDYEFLPGSYREDGKAEHLCVRLTDKGNGEMQSGTGDRRVRSGSVEEQSGAGAGRKQSGTGGGMVLELHYYVYPECDVIARSARLVNEGDRAVEVRRLMSLQVDFFASNYVFTSFGGGWAREMKRTDVPLRAGKHVNASYAGVSSSRANPFVILSDARTTEDAGDCWGFNLIYSGNHYEAAEVSGFGKTRFVMGINPQSFSWRLKAGAAFEAPEAVMAFSHEGLNGLSQHMHDFVREHIVRGVWKQRERPVLLNSWEAAYFGINERKLLRLAKAGKEAGIELFVMDDGWFGERDDDSRSLGDWEVNPKKLPNGLKGICDKVRALGMEFGIWVEPEMVNTDSELYRKHPEYAMDIPGREHSEGRSQRLLDLANQKVQDYIIEEMSRVFASADISYVKWDMNRIFSDVYAKSLDADAQGEVFHRYVCGLYRCMGVLTERFPEILFEGCSSGGNRFDLGILCYFPQIWASDNTDALCRAEIQNGYSYGYPMSAVSAHVSACPNHQTLRVTPPETRFAVAAFGIFGYECNLCDLHAEELAQVREQIALYKRWRGVLQFGRFYRGRTFAEGSGHSVIGFDGQNMMEWTCVSPDRKRAVGMLLQKLVVPNDSFAYYRARGLEEAVCYHFYNRPFKYSLKDFGGLVNMISPVHIRQDSLMEAVAAKFVKLDGEREDCLVYGDELMYHGVKLKQAFGSVGYGSDTRVFQDFGARMYFMEGEEDE